MSTNTSTFNLVKPSLGDPADITSMNQNWDKIDEELSNVPGRVITASSDDGVSYTATVPGVSSLYNGLTITIIPSKSSTSTSTTLNVNGLGAKNLRQPLTTNTNTSTTASSTAWLTASKPVVVMYDGTLWKTISLPKASLSNAYGTLPIANGGTGSTTASGALNNLGAASADHTHTEYAATGHTHNYAGSSSAGGSATSATKLETARTIDGVSFDGSANITHYGDCSTAGASITKAVSCNSFKLAAGASIKVKFTNANTADSPKLNVNETGGKSIQWRGSNLPKTQYWEDNAVLEFVYDGTYWNLLEGAHKLPDESLSSTSTNAVQNKAVTTALDEKAPNFFNSVALDGAELKLTKYNTSGYYLFTSSSNITIDSYALNSKKVFGYLDYSTAHETVNGIVTKYKYYREFRDLATGIIYKATTTGASGNISTSYTTKTPTYQ